MSLRPWEPRAGLSMQREGTSGTGTRSPLLLASTDGPSVALWAGQSAVWFAHALRTLGGGCMAPPRGEPGLWRGGCLEEQRPKGDQVSFLSSRAPDCRSGRGKAPSSHTCKMLHKVPGKRRSREAHAHSREQSPPSKCWSPAGHRSTRRSWWLPLSTRSPRLRACRLAGNGGGQTPGSGHRRRSAPSPRWSR